MLGLEIPHGGRMNREIASLGYDCVSITTMIYERGLGNTSCKGKAPREDLGELHGKYSKQRFRGRRCF